MNKSTKNTAAAIGASLTTLAATAAGLYFFGGAGGAKNRKTVSAWAEKAKKQVVAEIKAMEKMSKQNYNEIVDAVTQQYREIKNVDQKELKALAKELKGHWGSITKEVNTATKKAAKAALELKAAVKPKKVSKTAKVTTKKTVKPKKSAKK